MFLYLRVMFSLFLAVLLALIPISFWYAIIMRPHREGLSFFFFLVFVMAFGFAYVFKNFAEPYFSIYIPSYLGIFGAMFCIGFSIEYGKNIIVRFVGHKYFHRIDDVIDLSFATALGFTFYENIYTFLPFFANGFSFDTPVTLVKEVIFQIFYVLPIHMFCSGVFGFYYGLSHFATPQEQSRYGSWYASLQILKGTLISSIFYGLFFYLKSLDLRVNDALAWFGYAPISLNESFFPLIGFIFSSIGIIYLFQLVESQYAISETKEDQEKRITHASSPL